MNNNNSIGIALQLTYSPGRTTERSLCVCMQFLPSGVHLKSASVLNAAVLTRTPLLFCRTHARNGECKYIFLVVEASVITAWTLKNFLKFLLMERKNCALSTATFTSLHKMCTNFILTSVLWAQSESSMQNGTWGLGFISVVCFLQPTVGQLPICYHIPSHATLIPQRVVEPKTESSEGRIVFGP